MTAPYQNIVTARSRRLRTTGLVLLIAVLLMALYGNFSLMPSLRTIPHVAVAHSHAKIHAPGGTSLTSGTTNSPAEPVLTEPERKAALAKVLFVYGYWTVCAALILALILVAWLDFRELSRAYLAHQRDLYGDTLRTMSRDASEDTAPNA